MKPNIDNIYCVGTLQDLGRPYSALYVDTELRSLYMFVRIGAGPTPGERYLAAEVTPSEVERYMGQELGLVEIFSDRKCRLAVIENNILRMEEPGEAIEIPDSRMYNLNYFDPELCDDEMWIETVLDRINYNKPLEIA